jgi:hypothetical protein
MTIIIEFDRLAWVMLVITTTTNKVLFCFRFYEFLLFVAMVEYVV